MIPPQTIETTRLILRAPIPEDAPILFRKYMQDETVTRYLVWRPHQSVDNTIVFVNRCIMMWHEESAYPWVVVRKNDSEILGMIELRINEDEADIGYVLAEGYWRKGYATEMAKAVVDWLLTQEEIKRIWAICDCDNLKSARVLEKAGLIKKGILVKHILHPNISDELRDCFLFEILKAT